MPELDALAGYAPEALAGYARIRELIDADGALGAAEKALLVAVAAVARGQAELAAQEIRRGRSLGLREDIVALAAVAVLLSRGEAVCARLLAAAGGLGPTAERPIVGAEDGVAYFLAYNGVTELPPRLAALNDLAPRAFEGYFRMHRATLSSDPETDPLAELIMCALNAAELQSSFVAIHAAGARRRGVSESQLAEAILCAVPASGVGAWAAGAAGAFPDATAGPR